MTGKALDTSTLPRDHRHSVTEFIRVADTISASGWELPLVPGKWSPAQVAEHLRLSYEVLNLELSGKPGLRVRTSWWLRLILRFRVLPAILRNGRIGEGALAPREIRPGPGPFPREALLAQLRTTATDAEAALAERLAREGAGVTHHIFGKLPPASALRFLTVHNVHHTRQLTVRDPAPAGD